MTKHTPGPWQVHRTGLVVTFDGASSVAYPGEDRCQAFANGDELRGQANAKLIAAAPDLLEALKQMVELFDHCGLNGLMLSAGRRHGWTGAHVQERMAACGAARAAIVRAEG
jgi:hypothetical protein